MKKLSCRLLYGDTYVSHSKQAEQRVHLNVAGRLHAPLSLKCRRSLSYAQDFHLIVAARLRMRATLTPPLVCVRALLSPGAARWGTRTNFT